MEFDKIKQLLDAGIIIAGRKYEDNGIIRFERIDPTEIENIPEEERAYATLSMERAIFTIDSEGKIHNYKGVDSHLQSEEIGPTKLVNAKSIEYISNENSNSYRVSAIVFNDQKPEIRINGTSPLEDIEIEGDINIKLNEMGVVVPNIQYIKEIPQEYSLKYGLPIKVNGNISDFQSDYAKEDEERKKRLQNTYKGAYIQELEDNQRPESMREYLNRIGFISSKEVQEKITSLGYPMEDFVSKVDNSYSRGQRYGQAERTMGSPFRISDIETCMVNNDINGLQAIFAFSENQEENFENYLAKVYGKNIALLMNNGWECENLIHRQDFSLSGEFCDGSYFDIMEAHKNAIEKNKDEPYKADALFNETKRKYTAQVMHIASCVKIIQDAMKILGKSDKQIESVLNDFADSFTNTLDFKEIAQIFKTDENRVIERFIKQFLETKNWTEQMAGQDRKEGLIMDEAIYNSHINNEEFYAKVSNMIADRIKEKYKNKDSKSDIQNNYNTGIPISIGDIEKDEMNEAIKDWSEGDPKLEAAISSCIQNGIQTYASCKGHQIIDSPYLSMIVTKDNLGKIFNIMNEVLKQKNVEIDLSYMESPFPEYESISVLTVYGNMINKGEVFEIVENSAREKIDLNQTSEIVKNIWNFHEATRTRETPIQLYNELIYHKGAFSDTLQINPRSKNFRFINILEDSGLKKKEREFVGTAFYGRKGIDDILEKLSHQIEDNFIETKNDKFLEDNENEEDIKIEEKQDISTISNEQSKIDRKEANKVLKGYEFGKAYEKKVPKKNAEKIALLWGEGSPGLTKLIKYCIENDIKTIASCKGHQGKENTSGYVLFEMSKECTKYMLGYMKESKKPGFCSGTLRKNKDKVRINFSKEGYDNELFFDTLLQGLESYSKDRNAIEKNGSKYTGVLQDIVDKIYSDDEVDKTVQFDEYGIVREIENVEHAVYYNYDIIKDFCEKSKSGFDHILEVGRNLEQRIKNNFQRKDDISRE